MREGTMIIDQVIESAFPFKPPMHQPHLNPRIRSVVLDIRARHGAQRILGIGRNAESLCHHFRHAGYSVALVNPDDGHETSIAQSTSMGNALSLIDPSPVKGAPFDMAVSIESHETFVRPATAVGIAAAKLDKGGVYIVSIPYGGSCLRSLFGVMGRWWRRRQFRGSDSNQFQCWSRQYLTVILKSHGFTVMEFVGVRNSSLQWEALILVAKKTG
jgi:hypothetical protein